MIEHTPIILLVDDSFVNIEVLKDALKRYSTICANNGLDAIALALKEPKPDLILLDVVMPGIDGHETCKRLKSNAHTADIPIVFITGQDDTESIIKGFEVGAVDYIPKPFNIHELKARVKTQLTIKKSRDQNLRLLRKIESINNKLTDSINYAQKIQKASLPKKSFLNRVMPEYFVLLKPRDVVSGDFYWVGRVDTKTVIVVADSTGHGVPGAFMSMFGVAYLHELVGNNRETNPAKILNELRRTVIESLQQDAESEVKDGMDVSVLTINSDKDYIEYASAFNSILLIRDEQLHILPADHMPVSIGEVDKPFENHIVQCKKGDCFYLYSDGYASQFGGQFDKKLKQSGFRNVILANHKLPMCQQRIVFDNFFETWRGTAEQIDDVLLLGIRL